MVAAATSPPNRPPHPLCACPMPMMGGDSAPPTDPSRRGMMPSFMNGIMSPFMACWQPPISSCMTPTRPMRPPPPVVSPLMDNHLTSQSPQSPSSSTPLSVNIRTPHPNDVLCGRGGSSNRHVGNLNFRSLVAANKDMYITLTKKQKMMVARSIVHTVQSQDPPGRFLQKDPDTGMWFDIGLPRSLEKTSQALREKSGNEKTPYAQDEEQSEAGSSIVSLKSSSVSSPTTPTQSPTKSISPLTTPKISNNSDAPPISIPGHLEAQFKPRPRFEQHSHPSWSEYPHPQQQHGRHPPQQPYLPPFSNNVRKVSEEFHGPRPVPYSSGVRPMYPPHPPYPLRDHREHRYQPPRGQGYHPSRLPPPHPYPPMTTSSSSLPIPPSPHPSTHSHYASNSPAHRPLNRQTGNGTRETTEVSPGRRQEPKRRRTSDISSNRSLDATSPLSLSQDMEDRLSLREQEGARPDLASPSGVLQSRSRRSSHNDALSGLAALSSAALLKLDEAR